MAVFAVWELYILLLQGMQTLECLLTRKIQSIYTAIKSPQIKKRFKENKLGKMAWNGNTDYSFFSEEKDAAILLNYCYLKIWKIKGKTCYIAECHYTWEQPSKTIFDLGIFKITVFEQLFYELEKSKMLHPYTLICYFEKENT